MKTAGHKQRMSLPTMQALVMAVVPLVGCPGPAGKKQLSKPPQASPTPIESGDGKMAGLIPAPQVKPAERLALPPTSRFTLKNGLRVLFLRDAHVPMVSVKLLIRAGSIDDPADKVGLADFTLSMLKQGAGKMDAETIARTIDSAGARLSVSPGHEFSSISCRGRTAYTAADGKSSNTLTLCGRVVSQMIRAPSFKKKEMGQIRDGLLGNVRESRDSPSQLAALHFYNMLYGDDHPAGRPMSISSIKSIQHRDLLRFYTDHLLPKVSMLVISGDTTIDEAKKIAALFARWRGNAPRTRQVKSVVDPAPGLRVLLVDKPTLSQSSFFLGHAGVSTRHPHRDALRVANWVLGGGGFSSRLMQSVRAEGGKTYGISSAFYAHEADGIFRITSTTRNEELLSTLRLVQAELAKLHKHPPDAKEILAAKGNIAGGYAIRFKTGWQLASALALAELRGFGKDYVTDFPLRIQALTAENITKAARTHVRPRRLALAIVGKAKVVGPLLKKAGIRFEQISYLDAISARRRATAAARVTIKPAEQRQGRKLLARAVKAMGGKRALAAVKRLKITGTMNRGPYTTRYEALFIPPDHLRMTMELKHKSLKMKVVQVLASKTAFMINKGRKVPLPPHMVETLRSALWRQPAFLLRNASEKSVKLRPAKSKKPGMVGIDLYAQTGRPLTLYFAKKTLRLTRIVKRARDGSERVTTLLDHRRVGRLWLPHRAQTGQGKGAQVSQLESVAINPKISAKDILAQ